MGPRTEPWGTPYKRGKVSDLKSPFTTHCVLSLRYDLNHSSTVPQKPKVECNLLIKMSWSIVSKAALRSKSAIIEIFCHLQKTEGHCKFLKVQFLYCDIFYRQIDVFQGGYYLVNVG